MMENRFTDEQCEQMWADKYTFFWYNAREIFHWTQEDFDRKAKQLHEAGITRVMTFSVTHFRFCFRPFWPEIIRTIGRIVRSCHKYGIKVVEHSSSSLTYLPETPEEWEGVKSYLKTRLSSFGDFLGFEQYIMSNPELESGIRLSDLYQVDGRTGKAAGTPYVGRAFCYNNPYYLKHYLEHLHEVAKTGVDGILADDVQLFGLGNACTCTYCRKLFNEQTGQELPPPEQWEQFYNHFENPLFVKWLKFREWTTKNFQDLLTRKYAEWGIGTTRPNYCARLLARNLTANTFIACWKYWEHVFQENCYSQVIKISWPEFYTESLLQYSIGRRKNVPSMSLFYPSRYDQYFFSWALAESWGQIPFPCPEGFNMDAEDQWFNAFEKKHAAMFRNQQKHADCAFLISRESFDYTAASVEKTYRPLNSLMQAAYFADIQCDAVSEDEEKEAFLRQKCIVSIGTTLVSASLLEKLTSFVKKGGRLLIYGAFAEINPPSGVDALLRHPNVRRFPWNFGKETFQECLWVRRSTTKKVNRKAAPPLVADFLRHGPGRQLRSQLPEKPQIESVSTGFHADLFAQNQNPKHLTLHVLDLRDLLVPEGTMVSHDDPLVHFLRDAPRNDVEIEVRLNRDDIVRCRLISPSIDRELELNLRIDAGQCVIVIPKDSFAGYAAIDLILR